jgi:outer membrane protein TolC
MRIARETSPRSSIARERIRRAEARMKEARALAFPRLDARGSYVRFIETAQFRGRTGTDVGGTDTRARLFTERGTDLYTAGLDLSYTAFDGGSAYWAARAADADRDASRHDELDALAALDLEVSAAFLSVLLANGAVEIAEESLRFATEEAVKAKAREDVGEGLQVDRLRFETRASEARLALNRALGDRRIRRAVLAELLGEELDPEIELVAPEVEFGLLPGSGVAVALGSRPELAANRARAREAESRLSREIASRWPTLRLFASYGMITFDDIKLSQNEDEIQAGGALSWNLFEGGAHSARVEELRGEIDELHADGRRLELEITREVADAEISLEVARENVTVSAEGERLATSVLEQISARYAVGEALVLDVTAAEVERNSARLAYLRSRIELFLAQARLRIACGIPLAGDEGKSQEE